jgi:hypothetical protein
MKPTSRHKTGCYFHPLKPCWLQNIPHPLPDESAGIADCHLDMEFTMRRMIALFALCVMPYSLQSLHAAEVYRWLDDKGVSHYSQLPPPDSHQSFGKVNTAFTPAQQALIAAAEREQVQKKLLQQASIPPSAAGTEQTCQQLQQDKVAYLHRRIEEKYLSDRNDCEMTHMGNSAAQQRELCYHTAQLAMTAELSRVPSVKLCSDQ